MNRAPDFDLIVHGATGYTGRLVAQYLAQRNGASGGLRWAMAGRSADKLVQVRDLIGAPANTPLVVADSDDPAQLQAMVRRTRAVITTVGPYQLYGDPLVAACVAAGTDCFDLTGESTWMAGVIAKHDEAARASGARIVHSCGFDSIPFELGVLFCQRTAIAALGAAVPRVKARVRSVRGGLSGGTAASGVATRAAVQKDPSLLALLANPFALTPGFVGPQQPPAGKVAFDPDVGAEVRPFMMAPINSKNVHRSNYLMGHPWGTGFLYDEMSVAIAGETTDFDLAAVASLKPGEGPSEAEREAGSFDILFIGIAADGRQVRVSVGGDRDPGYGATAKMLAQSAICLLADAKELRGGVWTPGAAMQENLIARLRADAGMRFVVEA